MPQAALKHLAKRAKVSVSRAEELWDKAKGIVKSEYDVTEDDPSFWALRMGITKRMLGLKESISFKQFILSEEEVQQLVGKAVRALLKTDGEVHQMFMKDVDPLLDVAKEVENKEVKTAAGNWVIKAYKTAKAFFVQVVPPKGYGASIQYFDKAE
jgi:hypothetical protein